MALWAICFPLIATGLSFAPHLAFATLRALIAGGSLVALGIILRRPLPSGVSSWVLIGVAGFGATTLGFLGMFHAAEFVSPGIATVIANTQPLLAAGLGLLVLKERIGPMGALGLALGFLGIAGIAAAVPNGQQPAGSYLLGMAYIILAAFGIAFSNVAFKKLVGRVDPMMAVGAQLLIGAVPLAIISALTESPYEITWSGQFIFSLLGLALPGTALAYWMWLSVLEHMPLNQANAFSFLIPIFALAAGIAFYGETLTAGIIVGVGVTVVGVQLVHRAHVDPHADPESRSSSAVGISLR